MQDNGTPVVVVTGGTRGIGAEVVRGCLRDGRRVCATYLRDDDAAAALRAEAGPGRLVTIRADVTDAAAAQRVLDAAADLGPVRALVNNAGTTGRLGPFTAVTEEEVRRVVDVGLVGPLLLSRLLLDRWVTAGVPGVIVNVSSVAATLGAPGEYVPYAAAKAGIETMTVGLAKEFAGHGIRINAVSPGTTDTGIHAAAGDPGRPARVAPRIPMGRVGEPAEIAEAVTWLLSDKASYVTGAVLRVAGGL